MERPSLAASPTRLQANRASVRPSQSDPRGSSSGPWRNRSVVRVDKHVLVDLIGRDGAHGDMVMPSAPKRLLTVSFTYPVTACGMMNTKAAPLWLALQSSSPPPSGSTLRWDGCSFLQRRCPLLAVRKTTPAKIVRFTLRRVKCRDGEYCATRYASSRRSHVVLTSSSKQLLF